ncbi:MAG: multicopper oxidase family protein [Fusobacteriaceae bacterium]
MKKFLIIIGVVILASTIIFGVNIFRRGSMMSGGHQMMHGQIADSNSQIFQQKDFERKLLVPPMLEGTLKNGVREFNIETQNGAWEFITGLKTKTFGYNGPILGPVLKINSGEQTRIITKNSLNEITTVHWHGAEVDGKNDGVFNSNIAPGKSRTVEFTLDQPAATLWFHPHTSGKTASQVYFGLAGFLYLEDNNTKKIPIPNIYGVDDFPVAVQEKVFGTNGELFYSVTAMEEFHGKIGGTLIVNGISKPYVEVPRGIVRLRLLNGSNASPYLYDFGVMNFSKIASDGGFLNAPINMNNILLGSGERAEVLIDTTKSGSTFYMMVNGQKALEIRVKGDAKIKSIPKTLTPMPAVTQEILKQVKVNREFVLSSDMGSMRNLINGKTMDMNRIDFTAKKNIYELWTVTNQAGMMGMAHPFHIHGVQFRVIERNGVTVDSSKLEWEDTVLLQPGDTIKILLKFEKTGEYVYHCHVLEHEEAGMMLKFVVTD